MTQPEAPPALGSALARQEYSLIPVEEVLLHPENKRRGNVERIVESIRVNGWFGACGRQASTGYLIWGNHRFQALCEARERMRRAGDGSWEAHSAEEAALIESWRTWPERRGELDAVPMLELEVDDAEATLILIWDNTTSDEAGWDRPGLGAQLLAIEQARGSLADTPFTRPQVDEMMRDSSEAGGAFARPQTRSLSERFLVPPFSVLDARQGYWQDRKREWLDLGIRSEQGRPRNLLKMSETVLEAQRRGTPNASTPASDSGNDPQFFYKKQRAEERLGRELSTDEFLAEHYEGPDAYIEGTSIFDPVLCELAYRWWSPPGARVLDPFAGGSVRGIVASRLGREYVGLDLSPTQIAANEEQALAICRDADPCPVWVEGDARNAQELTDGEFDFVFSCPPYFNLEKYTDDPLDFSNSPSWTDFCADLDRAVGQACAMLKPGRFACFVVGNLRAEDGRVLDLLAATREAFERAGLVFYNDAILVTAIGSLAIRAARIFRTRKLGRTHQAVLTFLKPPLDAALEACGPIEVADPAEAFGRPVS